jgi:hypothetical protein
MIPNLRPRSGLVNLARRFNAGCQVKRCSRRVATVESRRVKRHYVTQRLCLSHPALKRRAKLILPLRGEEGRTYVDRVKNQFVQNFMLQTTSALHGVMHPNNVAR